MPSAVRTLPYEKWQHVVTTYRHQRSLHFNNSSMDHTMPLYLSLSSHRGHHGDTR